MSNYRSFEDQHGFLKFFLNRDLEYEIVVRALEGLKGSERWGKDASALHARFLKAFDGLFAHHLPPQVAAEDEANLPPPENLYDEFMLGLRIGDHHFRPCDILSFRRVHDECIRFFKLISNAYNLLTEDDRRDLRK